MSAEPARLPVAGTTTSGTATAAATDAEANLSEGQPVQQPSKAVAEHEITRLKEDVAAPVTPELTFETRTRAWLSQPVVASFVAGGVAGAVSRTVVSPLERLKILYQVQSAGRNEYKGSVWNGLTKIWKEEGFKGMMRGNGTNCIRIVPYSAVQYASFTLMRRSIFESYPGADLSALQRLVCGGMAGIISVSFTYPLDIVRTRLSIQSASFAALNTAQKESVQLPGMWTSLSTMYRTEGGFAALYRGIVPTVAGVAPYVGLNFMAYESIRTWVSPVREDGTSEKPSVARRLVAGACSGGFAQTCTYPFDVLRRRFQINTMPGMGLKYNSVWDAVRTIWIQEGVKGFYKGLWPNLLKVAPSMASSWVAFELTRDSMYMLDPHENE